MSYQTIRIESQNKACFTVNSQSAPLYVKGDILVKKSIHTEKEIVLHDSKAEENEKVYPGTLRFWGGNFYGYLSDEKGWVNWSQATEELTRKFIELSQEIERKQLWSPFYNKDDTQNPIGYAFYKGKIAIGKPFSGEGALEVGGDCVMDRKLHVKGLLKLENGIRLSETATEQPGCLRFTNGIFEGFNGNNWIPFGETNKEIIIQEKVIQPTISLDHFATKDYVDKMISLGMIWLPVMDDIFIVETDFDWIFPYQDKWNVGMKIWVSNKQSFHFIQLIGLHDNLFQFERLKVKDFEINNLYGVMVRTQGQIWWIQKDETGKLHSGMFEPIEKINQEVKIIEQKEIIREIDETKLNELKKDFKTLIHMIENQETKIKDGSIKSNHLQKYSIESHHIFPKAIGAIHLSNQCIRTEHLSQNCFNHQHLKDGCIESRHLTRNSITASNIAPNSIEEYHLSGKLDPCRVFEKGKLTGDWLASHSIHSECLTDSLIRENHIKRHTIRNWHFHPEWKIDKNQIGLNIIQTEHIQEISGIKLVAGTGQPNFFNAGSLPGWTITNQTLHGDKLIEDTLNKYHMKEKDRGIHFEWDTSVWSKENPTRIELGEKYRFQLNENVGLWQKTKSRDWCSLYKITEDIELGDKSAFDRYWWDDLSETQYDTLPTPGRWSLLNIYGKVESRGTWIHRGRMEIKGSVHFPELKIASHRADESYRYALYKSCPIGSILTYRKNQPIPTGWEEVKELPHHDNFIWIEKINVGLITEEVPHIDTTMVEEANQ